VLNFSSKVKKRNT